MRRVSAVSLLAFAILVFAPVQLHADEITITSGQATTVLPSDPVRMTLDYDNSELAIRWLQSFALPVAVCAPPGCHAGDVLSLNTTVFHNGPINAEGLENDAMGSLTVNGVMSGPLAFAGSLSFVTPGIVVPASTADAVTLVAPFTLSGTIQGFDATGRNVTLLFTDALNGGGTATLRLAHNPTNDTFQVGPLRYEFSSAAPTPEPAPMLLLGGALIAVMCSRYLWQPTIMGDAGRRSAATNHCENGSGR